ncbi:MAG: hypothetical protein WDN28_21060 [Chthoniobacter sp.]
MTGVPSDPSSAAISPANLTNLKNTVQAAVTASISQAGVNLQGAILPFGSKDAIDQTHHFQQSNGLGIDDTDVFTNATATDPTKAARSTGVAGAVTGFVAQ